MDPYEFSVLACDAMEWVGDAEDLWLKQRGRIDLSEVRRRAELHLLALRTAGEYVRNGGKLPEQMVQELLVEPKRGVR